MTLYVNESNQRTIWAYTITKDQPLSNKQLVRNFEDYGFDGMRCDVDGNLCITRYGKGTVVKLSPHGKLIQERSKAGIISIAIRCNNCFLTIHCQQCATLGEFITQGPFREDVCLITDATLF